MPADPILLAANIPDVPRWVAARALLSSGDCTLVVAKTGTSAVVLDAQFRSGNLIGQPEPALLRDALADVPPGFRLIVQITSLDEAHGALVDWTVAEVIVHELARPWPSVLPAEPGVTVSVPPDERLLVGLPDAVRGQAAQADAVAVRAAGGAAVAVCTADAVTDLLWNVTVDTVAEHRRKGYATACFRMLATWMAARGRQPVWCALAGHVPSIRLAAKLGFRPVDRLAVLTSPVADLSGPAGQFD
ncbi:MAG TPA: GNAT family N-acetyltransferase [Pseudonocardiaceae bacterium]